MYFITCFEKIGIDSHGWLDLGSQRTFGYRETFESAKEALELNMCDMNETIYNYAVVEKMGPYIHPDVEEIHFFKWDREREGFFEMDEKPKEFEGFCNIAFG